MALTNAERQARKRQKARLLQTAAAARGPGGLERLSEMVSVKTREMMALGILIPTIKDGLAAEKIIDAREARTDERQLAITLTMILSGASGVGPPERLLVGDGREIEGEFQELDTGDE
jgi:hypothetical protein